MVFKKLTAKQKKHIKEHKEKYGLNHSRSMQAYIMRGMSIEEAHKKAINKTPKLVGNKSKKRIKQLKKKGYEIKEEILPNGDKLILKRKKN